MKKKKQKGIDWSKTDMYEGIGRPDLRPKRRMVEANHRCRGLSLNDGTTFFCRYCDRLVTGGIPINKNENN